MSDDEAKLGRLVWIRWVDSMSNDCWQSIENSRKASKDVHLTCETVGWIVDESNDRISLVQSKSAEGYVNAKMTIPRVAVVEIVDILD